MGFTARIAKHIRSNVVGYVAVFLALTATAAALPGTNTVDSGDIINGEVKTPDLALGAVNTGRLAPNAVTTGRVVDGGLVGADIAPNALTGAQIDEAQLGQVPAATLGGLGRSGSDPDDDCDPESSTLIVCTTVDLTLPAQARVLVIGQIRAREEVDNNQGTGTCELGTSVLDLPSTSTTIHTGHDGDFIDQTDNTTLVGVTPPLGPGPIQFRIRCDQLAPGAITYDESEIAAVALSSS